MYKRYVHRHEELNHFSPQYTIQFVLHTLHSVLRTVRYFNFRIRHVGVRYASYTIRYAYIRYAPFSCEEQ